MKILKIITSILSVVLGIYILLNVILRVFIMMKFPEAINAEKINAASAIGIIGGADGPTAIFVAKSSSFLDILPIIIFLLSVIINIFLRIKIKKKG